MYDRTSYMVRSRLYMCLAWSEASALHVLFFLCFFALWVIIPYIQLMRSAVRKRSVASGQSRDGAAGAICFSLAFFAGLQCFLYFLAHNLIKGDEEESRRLCLLQRALLLRVGDAVWPLNMVLEPRTEGIMP